MNAIIYLGIGAIIGGGIYGYEILSEPLKYIKNLIKF